MAISLGKLYKVGFFIFALVALPLNFTYALLYVLGYFPALPFMGYATITHLFSPIVLLFLLTNGSILLNVKYFYLLIFFLFQVLVYTFVGYFLSDYSYNLEAFAQSFLLFYYLLVYAVLGFGLYYFKIMGSKIWLYFLYFFIFVVVCLYFKNGTFSFYFNLMNPSAATINYQEVSIIFLFVWFFYYAGVFDSIERIKSIVICVIILIASGARTEFYGFILALLYVFLLGNVRINFYKLKNFIIVFSILLVILFLFKDFIFEVFENSRHFSVTKLDSDGSWQEREYLKHKNLNYIYENPIFGSYASHFDIGRGFYIHNILSSWQQYGLLGFVLYLLLVVIPFLVISYTRVKTDNKKLDGFLFISTYSLIVVIVTKSVYWAYLGVSIGSFLYYCFYFRSKLILRKDFL